jgi:tRNA dimethylallyltransferase
VNTVAIVGPTASGKSRLAMHIASHVGGEIVSTDSMAIYRGMDIGTAKPSHRDRDAIPHHMIDVREPREDVSVAEFQALARTSIADIQRRGSRPILVGGSGLYVAAVLDDLEFAGTDPDVRAELERECARVGVETMHARLADVDPDAAAVIHVRNARRIIRALEVIALTGRPFPAVLPRDREFLPALRIGLRIDRSTLDARIADRVDQMWRAGFVDEVKHLPSLAQSRTASKALGYAQVLRALAGEISIDEAREETITATSAFARRQQRWFEKDQRISWVPFDVDPDDVLSMLT